MTEFYCVLIGFTAMLAGGFWGLGGGWYIVPALLALGVNRDIAATASLLQMCGSTFLTVAKQFKSIGWRRGEIGLTVALPLCGMAFIGGFFGKGLSSFIIETLGWIFFDKVLFISLMLWISYKSFMVNEKHINAVEEFHNRPFIVTSAGATVGVLSSFLGIGGGTLNRPLLTNVLHLKEKYTGKICRLAVFVTALSGSIGYLFLSDNGSISINLSSNAKAALNYAVFLVIGGSIGYPIGAVLHSYTVKAKNDHNVSRSFSIIALTVAVALLFRTFNLEKISLYIVIGCGIMIVIYLIIQTLKNKQKIEKIDESNLHLEHN
ncbi:sulfite exporter TauE/SafE family protein [Lentisphaerota bacterium WC36G]|nr:sulfite exporter TauE/SafE family protein [Lentisphaerae bacterium WC36]